jgi:hypothetical protein
MTFSIGACCGGRPRTTLFAGARPALQFVRGMPVPGRRSFSTDWSTSLTSAAAWPTPFRRDEGAGDERRQDRPTNGCDGPAHVFGEVEQADADVGQRTRPRSALYPAHRPGRVEALVAPIAAVEMQHLPNATGVHDLANGGDGGGPADDEPDG